MLGAHPTAPNPCPAIAKVPLDYKIIRKIKNVLMGDGRQILNVKNIHLTGTPVGEASSIQRRPLGCIDTGGHVS